MRLTFFRTVLAVVGLAVSCGDLDPETLDANRKIERAREFLEQIAATDSAVIDLQTAIRNVVDQDRA